jgi:2',3'-cyclic-nucleotide 2'-phosphodiesterase (5'-nucleotidase family)
MKWRTYLIYLVAFLLASCSVQYNLQSHSESIYDVKAENDSTIIAMIAPYKIKIDSLMNDVLCISKVEMTKGGPESLLGNFVCDLCLQQYANLVDICVMNNGGLRSILPKGEITRGDIYKLMPFENELVILELDETSFVGLVDYLISRGGEPFSGMKIEKDFTGHLSADYPSAINFNRGDKIRVLTSDYLANGGDKMWFFKDKEQIKVGIKLRDAIINYCVLQDTITSKLDQRLTTYNEE